MKEQTTGTPAAAAQPSTPAYDERPGHREVTGPSARARVLLGRQAEAATASSSTATFLTRLGSTWMPGPMVVETVTFLM